jgi:predicted RNA binding protein YcfA (HicA-like mRNA interferase family)
MSQKFKQKLQAHGWQFKRHGKGSHEIWHHPKRGIVTVSLAAQRGRVDRALSSKLFGIAGA